MVSILAYSLLKWIFIKYPLLIELMPKEVRSFWNTVVWEESSVCWLEEIDCQGGME